MEHLSGPGLQDWGRKKIDMINLEWLRTENRKGKKEIILFHNTPFYDSHM
jgi:hypothetical protein